MIGTPAPISARCRAFLAYLGLCFGAFDFGLQGQPQHPEHWVWYECNPSGQWHWLEEEASLLIAAAIADLLEKP